MPHGSLSDAPPRKGSAEDTLRAVSILTTVLVDGGLAADAARAALAHLADAVGADHGFLFSYGHDATGARVGRLEAQLTDPGGGRATESGDAVPLSPHFDSWVDAFERGQVVCGSTLDLPAAERRPFRPEDPDRAFIALPVHAGGELWGHLALACDDPSFTWAEAEVDALRAAVSVVGAVAARERAVDAMHARESELVEARRLEAVGILAGGIAHDFSNAMLVVRMNAMELQARTEGELSGKARDIVESAEHVSALVKKLLAFSRRHPVRPAVVDAAAALRRLEPVLRRVLPPAVAFSMHVPDAPLPVLVDPDQLEQAVLNLVTNARDAVGASGTVRVRAAELPGAAEVEIRVADDGHGIDAGVREHLFEPFFTTGDRTASAGLGLATVHGFASQAGGRVEVTSAPGAGAEFAIVLPLAAPVAPPAAAAVGPAAEPAPPARDRAPQPGAEQLLLVEDDPRVRRSIANLLAEDGYHVVQASCAEEALALLAEDAGRFATMVTDVVMPGMDGIELARHVRAEHGLPVLVMSAYPGNRFDASRLPAGVRFLPKTFDATELLDVVAELSTLPAAG